MISLRGVTTKNLSNVLATNAADSEQTWTVKQIEEGQADICHCVMGKANRF